MNPLIKFIERLKSISIEVEFISNYPWVYLDKVNGKKVTEQYHSEHGFVVGYAPIRIDQSFKFTELKEIFKIIRKYL